MAFQACLDEIRKAAGRDLTDDEIGSLLEELQKRQRQRVQLSGLEDMDKAVMQAADDYAKEMAQAAIIEKRNAALNLKARLQTLDFVKSQFGSKPELGLEAALVGVNRPVPGARRSAAAEQNQLSNHYLGGFMTDVESKGLWQVFVRGELDRDIARALWQKDANLPPRTDLPEEATQIADVIAKWQEVTRQHANEAGAWIKKMPGYIVRQSHDSYKLSRAGYEQWRDDILPKLDPARTFDGADPEKFLKAAYEGLSTGIHLKADQSPTGFKGPRNIAKRASAERVLHFKSADDWFDYNQKYGTGNLREALIWGFEWNANNTGLMRKFGPNPVATLEAVGDELKIRLDGKLRNQMAVLDGSARVPISEKWAKISSGVRVGENLSKLGAALLSQAADIPIYASEMRYQGNGMLSSIGEAIAGMTKGRNRAEMKEIHSGIGVVMEGMIRDVGSRFTIANDSHPGMLSRLQQLFFKWNGMNWWTDTLRARASEFMAWRLAHHKALPYAELDPDLTRTLGLFGINENRWDVIRQAATKQADGNEYVVTDTIKDLSDEVFAKVLTAEGKKVTPGSIGKVKQEIADQLRTYYVDRSEYAVIEPDQRTRAAMLRGTRPGTVEGEMLRFIGQFKSFVWGMTQKAVGREIYGRGANSLGEALKNGNGELAGLAQLILWTTVFGYGAMAAKDLAKGRTPRDPLDHKTWVAAMAQGGGAGIYGDFLFGEGAKNRFGGGLTATVAGPAAGTVNQLYDLYGRVREGDDVAAAAFRTMLSNTPFANLFYSRIVLDYLILHQIQEWLSPGSLKRLERRIEKENGQHFLVSPSKFVQ